MDDDEKVRRQVYIVWMRDYDDLVLVSTGQEGMLAKTVGLGFYVLSEGKHNLFNGVSRVSAVHARKLAEQVRRSWVDAGSKPELTRQYDMRETEP